MVQSQLERFRADAEARGAQEPALREEPATTSYDTKLDRFKAAAEERGKQGGILAETFPMLQPGISAVRRLTRMGGGIAGTIDRAGTALGDVAFEAAYPDAPEVEKGGTSTGVGEALVGAAESDLMKTRPGFLTTELPEAVTDVGLSMATGGVASGVLHGLEGFDSKYREAEAYGADEETRLKAGLVGAAIDSSEGLLPSVLKYTGKILPSFTAMGTKMPAGKLAGGLIGSATEGGQEVMQGWLHNETANQMYGKEVRDFMDILAEDGPIGLLLGFVFGVGFSPGTRQRIAKEVMERSESNVKDVATLVEEGMTEEKAIAQVDASKEVWVKDGEESQVTEPSDFMQKTLRKQGYLPKEEYGNVEVVEAVEEQAPQQPQQEPAQPEAPQAEETVAQDTLVEETTDLVDDVPPEGGPEVVGPETETGPTEVQAFPGGLPAKAVGIAKKIPAQRYLTEARSWLKKNFTSPGHIPEKAFEAMIRSDGRINRELTLMREMMTDLDRATKEEWNKKTAKLSKAQTELLDSALRGDVEVWERLPVRIRASIELMRAHVDDMTHRLIQMGVISEKAVPGFLENVGFYLHRSYKVHTEGKKHGEQMDPEVKLRLVNTIRGEFVDPETGEMRVTEEQFQGIIASLLDPDTGSPLEWVTSRKLSAKDVTTLMKRKNISAAVRELMGEYKDPRVNYVRSISKMANLLANHQAQLEIKAAGMGKFLFERKTKVGDKEFIHPIAAAGSAAMDVLQVRRRGKDGKEKLSPLYTTKEIAEAFENYRAVSNTGPPWLASWMWLNGLSKVSKTILSPMTQARNLFGNVGFAIAQGHWRVSKGGQAAKIITSKLEKYDTKEWREYHKLLQELRVVNDSTRAGELIDTARDATGKDLDEYALITSKNPFKRGGSRNIPGMGIAIEMYRLGDDIWKIYAFENEMARLEKAGTGMTKRELQERCATIVRNTYPTYSMVPRAVKALRRFTLAASFVSFSAETWRVGKNTLKLIWDETHSDNPGIRKIGYERAMGTIAAAGSTAGIAAISRALLGWDTEDERDALEFLPWWSQNNDIYWRRSEDGKIQYIDLSFSDPWATLKKPVNAILRGDSLADATVEFTKALADPFASEEIFTEAVIDWMRNKKASSGGEVYNEYASTSEQAKDVAAHLWKALEPGAVSSARKIGLAVGGKVGKYGQEYSVGRELAANAFGLRLQDLDIHQSMGFKGSDYGRGLSSATRILTSVARNQGEVSEAELREAYEEMEESRYAQFQKMRRAVRAAFRQGESESDILDTLKGSNLSEANRRALITGEYVPYKPSSQFLRSDINRVKGDAKEKLRARRDFIKDLAK